MGFFVIFAHYNPFSNPSTYKHFLHKRFNLEYPQILFFPRGERSGFTAYTTTGKITVKYSNIIKGGIQIHDIPRLSQTRKVHYGAHSSVRHQTLT
jgi:hypothetical protein